MPVLHGRYDYWLAPFVWDVSELSNSSGSWRAPDGAVGSIDIGPIDKGAPHAPVGQMIMWQDAGLPTPANNLFITGDPSARLTTDLKDRIASQLGLAAGSLPGDTVIDMIWELLTTHSDVTGADRCKPLVPTVQGNLELHMRGHSLARSEQFAWGKHGHTAKLAELLQAEYAQLKVRAALGQVTATLPAKALGWQEARYRRMGLTDYRELLPPQFRDTDTPLDPATTIDDDFNGAVSNTDLESWTGGNISGWTAVGDANSVQVTTTGVARNVQNGGAFNLYIANDSLSGTDHYAEANVSISGSENSGQTVGVLARLPGASSDSDYYFGRVNLGNNTLSLLYRAGGGSVTTISNVTPTTTAVDGLLLRVTCNGSTISVTYDGNTDISTTDTNVTTGNFVGIRGNTNSSIRDPEWDNFVAADLGAAAPRIRRNMGLLGVGR